ncbi:MAG: HAMP domain-containing histidine kinase [Gammaproteobacteria bacterium]|nr:HAMP domain-containing histidine kinase [Gammaproteobacteria bacterium]
MSKLKSNQQIRTLIYARFVFIALQTIAIAFAQHLLEQNLPFVTLYLIVAAEAAVNIGYFLLYKPDKQVTDKDYVLQLVVDVVTLTLLLFASGGASNPFVSLLLIPIAIASVTLPKHLLLLVTLVSISAYSLLLLTLDSHALHHMNMQQHFTGMWVNFMLSAAVIVVVIASLIKAMNRQEKIISAQREEQLRQEQLLALGAAAAQFAHRLATPMATANLLAEELRELNKLTTEPNNTTESNNEYDKVSDQLEQQLGNCRRHLDDFRLMAEQVKNNIKQYVPVLRIMNELQQELQLSFPQAQVTWQISKQLSQNQHILAEPILIPALLNLIQNAIHASNKNNSQQVKVTALIKSAQLTLLIKDDGIGFANDTLLQLGSELVDSESGLGMGVFLSHVTLEKMGGRLKLSNHAKGGAVAEITLPVSDQQ